MNQKTSLALLAIFSIILSLGFLMKHYSTFFLAKTNPATAFFQKPTGIGHALDTWFSQRAYPDKTLPPKAYYEAVEHAQFNMLSYQKNNGTADQWEALGPKNIAGRSLAVAFNPQNPNTIYTATASGGLWRSYSAGVGVQAWERVPLGFPISSITSIAIAPSDSNTLFIGTGEVYNDKNAGTGFAVWPTRGTYGIGILKSTDGGQTWQPSLDWSKAQLRGVQMVQFDPQNEQIVWAATTEGLYRSTNQGNDWSLQLDVRYVSDLVIHSENTDIMLAACGNFTSEGYGLYRSTDGGESWEKLNENNGLPEGWAGKTLLGICRNRPNNMYASIGYSFNDGELYHSSNAGLTWTNLAPDQPYTYGWFAHDVAAHPDDSLSIICAGNTNVWKYNAPFNTIDPVSYWYNWELGIATPVGGPEGTPDYVHADVHDIVYHLTDNNTIYFATDGGIFRSTDGGATFEGVNGGLQTTQFYAGFSNSPTRSHFAMGGLQDNSTVIYEGNDAWKRVIGGDGAFTAINPDNEDIVYGSYQWLSIQKSLDGGDFFYDVDPKNGGTITVNFIGTYALCQEDPNTMYAGTEIPRKSVNGGESWFSTNQNRPIDRGNNPLALAISPTNCDVVYLSTTPIEYTPNNLAEIQYNGPSKLFVTTNGGDNWQDITQNLPDRFFMDFAIDPTNEQRVFMAVGGYGTPHVFLTEDGGATWLERGNGLPDLPTNAIVMDPINTEHLYIGNDLGVFFSEDGGLTWFDFSENLPEATWVMDLSISPSNRKLRVATHGHGVYERDLVAQEEMVGISPIDAAIATHSIKNYPNPFSDYTTIQYELTETATVTVQIFNLQGQLVQTLLPSTQQTPNGYVLTWNGQDQQGQSLPSATYIYRITTNQQTFSGKMQWVNK